MDRKPLVTRAEAKSICNIRDTNANFDFVIDALVMVATEQLEKATGRYFTKQSFEDRFDTRQTVDMAYDDTGWSPTASVCRIRDSSFLLSGLNISATGFEVRYDPYRMFGDDTVMSTDDYYFDAETGKLTVMAGMCKTQQGLKVAYTAGWDSFPDEDVTDPDDNSHPLTLSESAPFMIKEACLLQVGYLYARRRTDNIGLDGDRSHGKADQYVQTLAWGSKMGLTKEAIGLIRDLKKPVLGRY
ncbi:hypothetical protein EVC24_064 [Rhizobium phage RHph_I4]|nr:hypothetical protein EVC24_064 [Rhizobium phage RHph_I4]